MNFVNLATSPLPDLSPGDDSAGGPVAATTEHPAALATWGNDALFMRLYTELKQRAHREIWRLAEPGAVGATTLVHEAYLRMNGQASDGFEDRDHFLGYATRTMRSIIVDKARRQGAVRRGGDIDWATLDTSVSESIAQPEHLLEVAGLLEGLSQAAPDLAQVVDLKFFCGLTVGEIAAIRGCSERTVQRDWDQARGLLLGLAQGQPLRKRD